MATLIPAPANVLIISQIWINLNVCEGMNCLYEVREAEISFKEQDFVCL